MDHFSYSGANLQKHMEKFNIKHDSKDFILLKKLLTMDPKKRITADEALNDEFFKIQPFPTADVFNGLPIPYPKRDFISDDAGDKSSSKQHAVPPTVPAQQTVSSTGAMEPASKKMRMANQMNAQQAGSQPMNQGVCGLKNSKNKNNGQSGGWESKLWSHFIWVAFILPQKSMPCSYF